MDLDCDEVSRVPNDPGIPALFRRRNTAGGLPSGRLLVATVAEKVDSALKERFAKKFEEA